ncbi:hypothetical protein JFP838_pA0179 (plasmid) [Clostridium perfringens]|uniref:Uncharacterized protein n=1 Tax=Clostridium perfringens TaxID=1502 RepID=A0A140GRD6_CLOPF|nr:hypothetical protein JFP838_pA0179 [Clostridium perfringens]
MYQSEEDFNGCLNSLHFLVLLMFDKSQKVLYIINEINKNKV